MLFQQQMEWLRVQIVNLWFTSKKISNENKSTFYAYSRFSKSEKFLVYYSFF
jgi:hypothetical protein